MRSVRGGSHKGINALGSHDHVDSLSHSINPKMRPEILVDLLEMMYRSHGCVPSKGLTGVELRRFDTSTPRVVYHCIIVIIAM